MPDNRNRDVSEDPNKRRRQQLVRLIQKRTGEKYTKIYREVEHLDFEQLLERLTAERDLQKQIEALKEET